MFFRLNLAEDLLNLALLVNQKGHAVHAHVGSPHELFLAIRAKAVRELSLSIGQQTKWQAEFVDELLMRLFAVQ